MSWQGNGGSDDPTDPTRGAFGAMARGGYDTQTADFDEPTGHFDMNGLEDEDTNLVGHVPDDIRRSASITLGGELGADAEDMTAPTRVRDDELRAALAGASPQRPSAPAPQRPMPRQPAPHRFAPAARPAPSANPFATQAPDFEDATEQATFKVADLERAARGQLPPQQTRPAPMHQPPASQPSWKQGYDAHSPASHTPAAPAPSFGAAPAQPQQPSPFAPASAPPGAQAPAARSPFAGASLDEGASTLAQPSWAEHVDDSPVARPAPTLPTGFGPPAPAQRHPGAPVPKKPSSADSLISAQLAELGALTRDEHDAVINNMIMLGVAAGVVLAFVQLVVIGSKLFSILLIVGCTGGALVAGSKMPRRCESILNVFGIHVRKDNE